MNRSLSEWIWEAWCIISCIGIWPRYIEPKLLTVTKIKLPIPHLPHQLDGLKIVQFSDLHWSHDFSPTFQKKIIRKINALKPDIILFTGDFLSRSHLENQEGLLKILNSLQAKHGCFAVLGNHDYDEFVTVNSKGDYDVDAPSSSPTINKGFKRLFHPITLTKHVTEQAKRVAHHKELLLLLKNTPFHVLKNECLKIPCRGTWINICGLEEYSLAKIDPQKAFVDYDPNYPGIVLSHNPDSLDILKDFPGDLILSGHTHGGQVNIPGLWHRFTLIEHLEFKQGLKKLGNKWAYINRGLSSVMNFRWFAPPELTLLTLTPCPKSPHKKSSMETTT